MSQSTTQDWHYVAMVEDVPENIGVCAKIGDLQIAVFNFSKTEWYACQNMCPHRLDNVLSRGLIGDKKGEPMVACPHHKKSFSLRSGECLSGENYEISTFPVKVQDGKVYVAVE